MTDRERRQLAASLGARLLASRSRRRPKRDALVAAVRLPVHRDGGHRPALRTQATGGTLRGALHGADEPELPRSTWRTSSAST